MSRPMLFSLTKHNVARPDDCNHIGNKVTLGELVRRCKVAEPRGLDFTAIWLVASIRDEVDTKLPLGSFNGRVRLPWGDRVALREKLKVVNEGFHVIFHSRPRRW